MEEVPWYSETIELKPSTELLSDEYDRQDDKGFMVQIIYGKSYAKSAKTFEDTLTSCGFTVRNNPFEKLTNILDSFREAIKKRKRRAGIFVIVLCNGSPSKDGAGKLFDDNGESVSFVDVWDDFIKMDCLNRLPKIFLFQTHLPPTRDESDGIKPKRLYDVAAPGADLFLICRTTKKGPDGDDAFIKQFCDFARHSGEVADIFEIATFATTKDRPLIVSTLTAKFFFKKAENRQYNYQIMSGLKVVRDSIITNN